MKIEQNNKKSFITQDRTPNRPKTSYIERNKYLAAEQLHVDPEIDPVSKMKAYKEELKKLQNEYVSALSQLNVSRKMIDTQYRNSQKTKVHFLNLYENRKMKILQRNLLSQKSQNQKKNQKSLRENAKSIKLNSEIRSMIIKNQIEEIRFQKCQKNKKTKEELKRYLEITNNDLLLRAKSSFNKVRNSQLELQQKKKKIEHYQSVIAKQNYFRKIGSQLRYIEQFNKQLAVVNQQNNLLSNCASSSKGFFLTQKKD